MRSSNLIRRSLTLLVVACSMGFAVLASARDPEECQQAWGQAVRSYLTQNRTQGPEDEVFAPACQIEGKGDVDVARVEAVLIGARALARLDPRGCTRFLDVYVQSKTPDEICSKALSATPEKLRSMIQQSLPPAPKRRSK